MTSLVEYANDSVEISNFPPVIITEELFTNTDGGKITEHFAIMNQYSGQHEVVSKKELLILRALFIALKVGGNAGIMEALDELTDLGERGCLLYHKFIS